MVKKSEVAQFKNILLDLQARLRGDVEQLKGEALDNREGDNESKSPTHIAELGTQNYEQDFSLRAVESELELLDEIEAALKRIEEGTYGQCESCREEGKAASKSMIPKARLRAIPYARNCVTCERKRENLTL